MFTLLCLPNEILFAITRHLHPKDLVQMGNTSTRGREFIYNQRSIWTRETMFPANDPTITDRLIKHRISRIVCDVSSIQLLDLPSLNWESYFLLFDQFSHSLTSITIRCERRVLSELWPELTCYTFSLWCQPENSKLLSFGDHLKMKGCVSFDGVGCDEIKWENPPFPVLNHLSVICKDRHMVYLIELAFAHLSGPSLDHFREKKFL
ncbi:unnamed protein product [Rhizopus stolonifer]